MTSGGAAAGPDALAGIDPDAAVGTIVAATVDGEAAAVVRHAHGWVLVADWCTHAQCRFTDDGEVVDGTTLVCNCHGSEFDLRTGEVLVGPAETALEVQALVVESGTLRGPQRS